MEIYITYRRIDSLDMSGRIYDRLAKEFGADAVFRDFESTKPADDFGARMIQETSACKVLIVVIGLQWLAALDPAGNRKIDSPKDWVYREITAFLTRPDTKIFPLLVHGARMPLDTELPAPLADLANRYAVDISGGRDFQQDMSGLIDVISQTVPRVSAAKSGQKVFIVHGRDDGLRESVARFVERQSLPAIVLMEQISLGRTVIEKFEQESQNVGYAIILLTPDDLGGLAGTDAATQERARQNVIFELGYFIGQLGRSKVCLLHKGSIEIPSDINGVVYVEVDDAGAWRYQLAREMKGAGLTIDLNNV